MSEFFFGLHHGYLAAKADKIAEKHGAWHTNYNDPSQGKRGWFSCRNCGEPFNSATARIVMAAIDKAGGIDGLRLKSARRS